MGSAASTVFQAEEAAALLAMSAEGPWPFDSDRWLNAFHFKEALPAVPPKQLQHELRDPATRLGEVVKMAEVPDVASAKLPRSVCDAGSCGCLAPVCLNVFHCVAATLSRRWPSIVSSLDLACSRAIRRCPNTPSPPLVRSSPHSQPATTLSRTT